MKSMLEIFQLYLQNAEAVNVKKFPSKRSAMEWKQTNQMICEVEKKEENQPKKQPKKTKKNGRKPTK